MIGKILRLFLTIIVNIDLFITEANAENLINLVRDTLIT